MSSASNTEADGAVEDMPSCCSFCGIADKLVKCDGCDLVSYCGVKCQEDHRPLHEGRCKERAAELRDEILFKQPESTHLGDCPICMLPLLLDNNQFILLECCSKPICCGCTFAMAEILIKKRATRADEKCPLCRRPANEKENQFQKRVEANDPLALRHMGMMCFQKGDHESALKYTMKAAEFGDGGAHYKLFSLYKDGKHVEKDEEKKLFHLEEAAIAGHPYARCHLAEEEYDEYTAQGEISRMKRSAKHLIIGANLGHEGSIKILTEMYKEGGVSKEDFTVALRAHHAAVNATKSPNREKAAALFCSELYERWLEIRKDGMIS